MTAGDSHWQLGRAESHGHIVKRMLSSMDLEEPIVSFDDFRRCLRQAFAGKNSMGQVRGFSPEQAVLGKSKSLPGSLMADHEATSHSLLDSESPEGVKFREDLQRRERARRAFVSADNDGSIRRALLRRPRREPPEFKKGDWVLYWRKSKGNLKGDRGRWHGPGQVIVAESSKVVWISHSGYLIRASPQQIRPVSLREFKGLPRNGDGTVKSVGINLSCKNFVDVCGDNPNEETGDSVPNPSTIDPPPMPSSVISESQPDGEEFPPDVASSDAPYSATTPAESVAGDHVPTEEERPERPVNGIHVPVPDEDQDLLFGDILEPLQPEPGFWEIGFTDAPEIEVPQDFPPTICENSQIGEWSLLATVNRKQKVEVQWNSLNASERSLFQKAKEKEIQAWVNHKTVCRLAKGTLTDDQIMRCRWILTWKAPSPGTSEQRAKARLVVRGFEDPQLSSIAADAPTLTKDGKQLVLQQVASRGWKLVNFDIATAFLKGAGDGRQLGIHPPEELQQAIGMQPGEQCGLIGGAYGRADALLLWYRTIRETLEDLGFVVAPFDGCVFSLITKNSKGQPQVRGCLGLHVDDGIGGGDSYFGEVIGRLRKKFEFGAYNEAEFEFCGVRYFQWDDGSIELGQDSYIQKIDPIEIPRNRRTQSQENLTPTETQRLRQLCGSLQYAAVHTRPDLAAKVGEIQAMVTKARVEHMVIANRILYEAKTRPVNLMIVPIQESSVTFCAFSDASFETGKGQSTRQGTLIFATDGNMERNIKTVVCPMAWASRKIPRVVRSTLSAEAFALGATLDRLSWLRVFWEWMKNPSIDWSQPSEVLGGAPKAMVATDCKSVFDLSTKTSTPACTESRTTLECLLIRERLMENCRLRWVSSRAMLADCLTKSMDGEILRQALKVGKYSMFDENTVLQARADKRAQLRWVNEGTAFGT